MKIFAVLFTTAAIAIGGNTCLAQQVSTRGKLLDVPIYPISAIAEFETGGWSELEPRKGPKINKERMPRIVIFTKKDEGSVFRLAKKVDELVSKHDWGKWCALVVCHQNDPTPSEKDWARTSAQLKSKAEKSGLAVLSVGHWKRLPESLGMIRTHRRFDGFNGYDVAVFFRNPDRRTQYMELLDSEQIDDDTIARVSQQLNGLIASLPEVHTGAVPTKD